MHTAVAFFFTSKYKVISSPHLFKNIFVKFSNLVEDIGRKLVLFQKCKIKKKQTNKKINKIKQKVFL